MSVLPTFADEAGPGRSKAAGQAAKLDQAAVLGAVREDVRQTLRMGWIDPAFDALSAHPAFFTAGWSAARPNVGRSFIALTKAIREEAVSVDGMWAGFVRAEAGSTSDWHHHGEYETSIYVIAGRFLMEFAGNRLVHRAGP